MRETKAETNTSPTGKHSKVYSGKLIGLKEKWYWVAIQIHIKKHPFQGLLFLGVCMTSSLLSFHGYSPVIPDPRHPWPPSIPIYFSAFWSTSHIGLCCRLIVIGIICLASIECKVHYWRVFFACTVLLATVSLAPQWISHVHSQKMFLNEWMHACMDE